MLAVDGVLIKISKPSYNGTQYFSRKGFYGLNVQAGVDSDRRILYLTVKSSGSTHDSTAWKSTKLAAAVAAGKLPVGYYIVGDDAYKSVQARWSLHGRAPARMIDEPAASDDAERHLQEQEQEQ